jgi:hypothetical protein
MLQPGGVTAWYSCKMHPATAPTTTTTSVLQHHQGVLGARSQEFGDTARHHAFWGHGKTPHFVSVTQGPRVSNMLRGSAAHTPSLNVEGPSRQIPPPLAWHACTPAASMYAPSAQPHAVSCATNQAVLPQLHTQGPDIVGCKSCVNARCTKHPGTMPLDLPPPKHPPPSPTPQQSSHVVNVQLAWHSPHAYACTQALSGIAA